MSFSGDRVPVQSASLSARRTAGRMATGSEVLPLEPEFHEETASVSWLVTCCSS